MFILNFHSQSQTEILNLFLFDIFCLALQDSNV